jgi:Na+-driven multidrug efflux pump
MILEGPIGWALVTLAGPSALSMMLSVLGGMVCTLFLGRILGSTGLAVAASMAAVELGISVVFQALANGAMVVLARAIGAGSDRAGRIVMTSLLLTALVGSALCVIGLVTSGPVAALLAEGEMQPLVRSYLIGFALATPPLGIAMVSIAIFAAAGWAQVAFWRGIGELVLLAIFAPLFIERLGVIGAPLALCAASVLTMLGMLWTLVRRWDELRLGPRPWIVVDRSVWRSIAAIGVPPQIGRLSSTIAYGFMVGLVLRESATLAAAIGVAFRLLTIATTPGIGLSRAQAIVAGQCIGARKPERAIRSLGVAFAIAAGTGLILGLLAPLATPLVELFTSEAPVIAATMETLDIWRWLVFVVSAWYIFLGAYSATGRVGVASVLMIVSDALAIGVMLMLDTSWSAAAPWAIATQHVARAVLLALLLRRAYLAPLARTSG